MTQQYEALRRSKSDFVGLDDSSISHVSDSCDSANLIRKIEDCNREVLELVDIQKTFVTTDDSEVSQKLVSLQTKFFEAVSAIEKGEALRQSSEYNLDCTIKANKKLQDICRSQYLIIQAKDNELKESKRSYEESLQQTITHCNSLNKNWHKVEATLKDQIALLTQEKENIREELMKSQADGIAAKERMDELCRELEQFEQQIASKDKEITALKNNFESLIEAKCQEKHQVEEQYRALELQTEEWKRNYQHIVRQMDCVRGAVLRGTDALGTKVAELAERLEMTDRRLMKLVIVSKHQKGHSAETPKAERLPALICEEKCYRQLAKIARLLERHVFAIFSRGEGTIDGNESRTSSHNRLPRYSTSNGDHQDAEDGVSAKLLLKRILHDLTLHLRHCKTTEHDGNFKEHVQHGRHKDHKITQTNDTHKHAKDSETASKFRDHVEDQHKNLLARLKKSTEEVNRWRRRWKQQQLALHMEQQRLAAMKETQQADQRLKKKFLSSVCQLIHEASRQIDRIVCKHVKRLSMTTTHAEQAAVATERSNEAQAQPARSSTSDLRSRRRDEARSNGDNPEPGIGALVGSVWRENHNDICLHTNCNNNVGLSPNSNTGHLIDHPSYCTNTAASMSISGSYMWTDSTVDLLQQLTPKRGPIRHDSFEDLDDCRSAVQSVATTSDPFETDSDREGKKDGNSLARQMKFGDGGTDPGNFTVVTDDDDEAEDLGDVFTTHSADRINALQTKRWLEFRSAVRFELGRVMGSVVNHAKQDDSVAKDCLDAILDLQKRLINDVPLTPVDSEYCTPSNVASNGEGKHKLAKAASHSSNVIYMTEGECSADKKEVPQQTSPAQASMPFVAPTPEPADLSTTIENRSEVATRHNLDDNPEVPHLSESVGLGKPALDKGSYCLKRDEHIQRFQRAAWKPVGGVVHPPRVQESEPFHHRCAARRQRAEQKLAADGLSVGSLPMITNRRVLQAASQKLPGNVGFENETTKSSRASSDSTASRSCVLPPLTKPGKREDNSKRHGKCYWTNSDKEDSLLTKEEKISQTAVTRHSSVKSRYRLHKSILEPPFDEPTAKLGPFTPSEHENRKARTPTLERAASISGHREINSSNISTEATSPLPVQWLEVDEADCINKTSPSPKATLRRNNCCCGSACCLAKPEGQ